MPENTALPPDHDSFNHHGGEHVQDGCDHTNRVESFWAMVARAYKEDSYKMSQKRLERYVLKFGRWFGLPELLGEHPALCAGTVPKRLTYGELLAPNGSNSGAWAAWVSVSNPSRARTSRFRTLEYRQFSRKEEAEAGSLLLCAAMATFYPAQAVRLTQSPTRTSHDLLAVARCHFSAAPPNSSSTMNRAFSEQATHESDVVLRPLTQANQHVS